MKHTQIKRAGFAAAALLASAGALSAAPAISRLTPPSALFTFGDAGAPYTARFLTGQRFDLQATIRQTLAPPSHKFNSRLMASSSVPPQGSLTHHS